MNEREGAIAARCIRAAVDHFRNARVLEPHQKPRLTHGVRGVARARELEGHRRVVRARLVHRAHPTAADEAREAPRADTGARLERLYGVTRTAGFEKAACRPSRPHQAFELLAACRVLAAKAHQVAVAPFVRQRKRNGELPAEPIGVPPVVAYLAVVDHRPLPSRGHGAAR